MRTEDIKDLQQIIDKLRQTGLGEYVEQRKLALLDSRLEMIDKLLKSGILK